MKITKAHIQIGILAIGGFHRGGHVARSSIRHAAIHFSAAKQTARKYGRFYAFTKGFARYGGTRGEENTQTTIGHTHSDARCECAKAH